MRYHKEEVAHVGTESVYVKHCRATRCAFVKPATEKGVMKDLMYVYQPQGLDRQADEMRTLLARFQSRNLAACFLEALQILLRPLGSIAYLVGSLVETSQILLAAS